MDLFYANAIKRFCIVTTDCDFLPLVLRLRREGCLILGIGKSETPKPLQDAYSKFISTEDLLPTSFQPSASCPTLRVTLNDVGADESIRANLLMKACRSILETGKAGGEWITIQRLGSELGNLVANKLLYKKLFAKKGLAIIVREHTELFEIREQGWGGHLEVKPRTLE